MKIGFSFGRCVRDVVNGTVELDDVLVIVAGTHVKDRPHIRRVIEQYLHIEGYLIGLDPDRCHAVAEQLWDLGKLHQPRAYGTRPAHITEEHVWMDVVPTVLDMDPGVKEAWDQYRTLLVMRGNVIPNRQDR